MFDTHMFAFIALAALLTITPGADTMLVLRSVLTRGRRAGLVTTLGICTGLFVHAILSALGLSAILMHSATAFTIMKFAGACYLIFLGIQTLIQATRTEPHVLHHITATDIAAHSKGGWQRSFTEGMLSNVLNPKVAIFYLALLPQFIAPSDPVLAKSIVLAALHFLMGIGWLCALVFCVGKMGQLLTRPHIRKKLEMFSGAVLIGLGLRLAMERR